MKLGKKIFTSVKKNSFVNFFRLSAASFLVGAVHMGCMESGSPGAVQTQAMAVRVENGSHPQCRDQTLLLILDEDAIKNPCQVRREGCAPTSHGSDKDQGKDKDKDKDDDKDKGHDKDRDGGDDKDKGRDKGHDKDRDGDDDERKVTICHRPPGNPGNAKTLSVGASAVKAHLDHGDKLGSCGSEGDDSGASVPGVGCMRSAVGYRGTLAWFAKNVGAEILLPGGEVGDEGWFAPTTIRIGWKSAGPDSGDGLRNYLEAGPGLGTPDAKGNKETLLENVPELAPLRATGLSRLEGRSVCAVVLDGDVKMSYNPRSGNIQGPNLGKIAFQVLGTENAPQRSGSTLPSVRIRVLDAEAVCSDPLAAFQDAPESNSKCDPRDVDRPSCAVQRTLINEPWNSFDSTLWKGDGDQAVGGGLFFARDGASSAAADWISPCPVTVESTTALRFSNRLHLNSSMQNDFAESGALFLVNADNDGATFDNYIFVNVGYTMQPSKVFVELFGSNGGVDFDQYEETSLPYSPSQVFSVDLNIMPRAYNIAVGGELIDTVNLAVPIASLALFEVGVQQNSGGLRGLIDQTTLSKLCQAETIHKCRRHSWGKSDHKKRLSPKCHTRNSYIRLAKEQIKHCAHPSAGLRILCKMKERPESD